MIRKELYLCHVSICTRYEKCIFDVTVMNRLYNNEVETYNSKPDMCQ